MRIASNDLSEARRRFLFRATVSGMSLFDKAKKLAAQAKDLADDALAKAQAKRDESEGEASAPPAADPRLGTPYVPGMLGREGWRERGLTDPAAILPVDARERAGIPHSTKSEIVEEPFGMGRRWSAGARSAALFYQLYPEQQSWQPDGGATAVADVRGATTSTLPDGRSLVFVAAKKHAVVLETSGLDEGDRHDLALVVADQVGAR
jgi:hypothetical protein